jgi:hypothetical protein
LKPWQIKEWCIPPATDAAFVCQMEEVLAVYTQPRDPARPLVCVDEMAKQLLGETRSPIPATAGQPERQDYEYVRHGVCNLFMCFAPLENWRHVDVTERRTKADWARCMRDLVDIHFPDAPVIDVVLDNLNTHTPAALYEVFPAAEARRIRERLVFHYTPKHGSWLNMAEIELSVLSQQCLDRRIPDQETVAQEVAVWEQRRNDSGATVDWRFTTEDARIKLKRLYPMIE